MDSQLMENKNIKLSLQKITQRYDKNSSLPALDHVSADIYEGEFLSILGPSGCGKTTLLRIIIGLLQPTEGQILLDGKDITNSPASARSMGIVFQNYALFENMTVLGNVVYAAYLKAKKEKTATKAEITDRALRMLELLGISELKDKYPDILRGASTGSAGMFIATQAIRVNIFNDSDFACLQIPMSYELEGVELDLVEKNYVDRAHRRNIAVQYWTINDADDMRTLIELGCDCIMTDDPELLESILEEYKK